MWIFRGYSYVIYSRDDSALPTVIVLPPGQTVGSPGVRAASVFSPAADPLADTEEQSEAEPAEAEALAREQATREETLQQATAVLRATGGVLSQPALDQLVGLRNDRRATQALVQAASGAADRDARVQATTALWHHAADLEFTDAVAVSALEQLANDADVEIQQTARQALADMQQYRQRNPAP